MLTPPIAEDYRRQRPNLQEPIITINGSLLTTAQAMTVRVALESFAATLTAEGLGDDEHGKQMAATYILRIAEIRVPLYRGLADAF